MPEQGNMSPVIDKEPINVPMARKYGAIATSVALVFGGAIFAMRGGGEVNAGNDEVPADTEAWYETRPAEVDDCVVAVNESGTGSTIEMIIDGKRVEVVKNDLGSDKPVGQTPSQDTRLFTDGARNPFTTGPDAESLETEVKASLCEDPALAVSTAHAIGNYVFDGKRLADLEGGEWIKPYADLLVEDLNNKAEYLMGADLEITNIPTHLERYTELNDLAGRLGQVLDNLSNEGVYIGKTVVDYSFSDAEGIVATDGRVPEIAANENQFEDAQAIHFTDRKKGEVCVPGIDIGFNTGVGDDDHTDDGDQRIEIFVPQGDDECEPDETIPHQPTVPEDEQPPTTGPTTTRPGTTTTTRPGTTTTVPDKIPKPPVTGGPSTTVEAPVTGPSNPTTSTTTTTTRPNTTTTAAGEGTTTTEPAGEWEG